MLEPSHAASPQEEAALKGENPMSCHCSLPPATKAPLGRNSLVGEGTGEVCLGRDRVRSTLLGCCTRMRGALSSPVVLEAFPEP